MMTRHATKGDKVWILTIRIDGYMRWTIIEPEGVSMIPDSFP